MIKKYLAANKKFLKGSFILLIGSLVLNIASYIFNLVTGRMLGPSMYGELVTILSLLAVISIPVGIITTSITKFSSELKAKEKDASINGLARFATSQSFILGLIFTLALIILSIPIGKFLNINYWQIILISPFFLVGFPVAANRGLMQGLQKFSDYSINIGLEPILKIAFFIALFSLGLNVKGAVIAITLANIIVYLIGFIPLKNIFRGKSEEINKKEIINYSFSTTITYIFLTLLTYIDILMVKHFFSPDQAGLYSALAVVGKIVMFASIPIIAAMFPMISELFAKDEKHYHIFGQSLLFVVIVSLIVISIFGYFPDLTVRLTTGVKYMEISKYLFKFGISMMLLSLITIFVNYFLAIGKKFHIIFLIFSSILEIVLLWLFHSDFTQVVNVLLINFSILLVLMIMGYLVLKKNQLARIFVK